MFKNLVGAAVLALSAAAPAQTSGPPPAAPPPAAPPLKVGFVYVTPIGQAGWTWQHELGRRVLERALGPRVQTTAIEGVAEGPDSERVMRDLVAQGHKLVFATSFGYLEPALRVAADAPGVAFEHAGGYKTASNLGTYNARFYEGRWLAGWLAGKVSTSGVTGYVAGFPVPEVVQGINAFALGLRAANPRATVRVLWLDTWFDPARERDAALALVRAGADVLTHHSASTAVPQAAEEKGVRLVAYHSDMRAFAPRAQLAAVTANWGPFYARVAQQVLDGRWRPQAVWGGLKDGMVQLEGVDPALPPALREQLEAQRQCLVDGRLHPFGGRLVDQRGQVRQSQGVLDDRAIAGMDWLVEGVVGTLPGR